MGSFEIPNFGGRSSVRGWDLYQSEALPAHTPSHPPQLHIALQLNLLHNLPPFGRYFNDKFLCTMWYGVRGEFGVRSCTNQRPTHDFQIPLNTKFYFSCLSVWSEF